RFFYFFCSPTADKSNGGFVCCWQSKVVLFFFFALRFITPINHSFHHITPTSPTYIQWLSVRIYRRIGTNREQRCDMSISMEDKKKKNTYNINMDVGRTRDVATK